MRTTLTTILILFTLNIQAQYDPFVVQARQWNQYVKSVFLGSWTESYTIGDSIQFDGQNLPCLLRIDTNDVILDTVMLIKERPEIPSITFYPYQDNLFPLIYGDSLHLDLSMNLGDSAFYRCEGGFIQDSVFNYALDSIGTFTDLTGHIRKQYHFNATTPFGDYYFQWTEGIGNLDGALYYIFPIVCVSDLPAYDLTCVFDSNGSQIYKDTKYPTCLPIRLEELNKKSVIEVYPNPTSHYLRLENTSQTEEVTIMDSSGQLIKRWPLSGELQAEFSLEGFKPGIYLIQLKSKNSTSTRRLVVRP